MKKEARGDLFKKLEEQAWSSDLLKSSRTLGQNKETMKQKLRRALNEQRQGLEQSDKNVPLFVRTKDDYNDDEGEDDSDGDSDNNNNDVDMDMPASFSPAPVVKPATPVVAGSALKVGSSILIRKSTGKKPVRRQYSFCLYSAPYHVGLFLTIYISCYFSSRVWRFLGHKRNRRSGKSVRARSTVQTLEMTRPLTRRAKKQERNTAEAMAKATSQPRRRDAAG